MSSSVRYIEVITKGGQRKTVTLVMERPGRWRHPSGLALWKFARRSSRWHLGLGVPLHWSAPAYREHPRHQWWLASRSRLGDTTGRGLPLADLVQSLEWALAD